MGGNGTGREGAGREGGWTCAEQPVRERERERSGVWGRGRLAGRNVHCSLCLSHTHTLFAGPCVSCGSRIPSFRWQVLVPVLETWALSHHTYIRTYMHASSLCTLVAAPGSPNPVQTPAGPPCLSTPPLSPIQGLPRGLEAAGLKGGTARPPRS